MRLDEYLKETKRNMVFLAKEAGVDYKTLRNLMVEGTDVRGSILLKLSKATKGKVKMHEMVHPKHLEKCD